MISYFCPMKGTVMNIIRNLLYLLLLCVSTALCGQNNYVFRHFSTNDGLLNNEVKAIIRDKEGFLWIGTASGLNRYDGCRLKSYTSNMDDPCALLEDDIESLQEDAEGHIWVRGRNTYMLYDRKADCFYDPHSLFSRIRIPEEAVLSLVHIDLKGNVWVLSGNCLYYYQYAEKALFSIDLPQRVEVMQIADDGQHLLLISNSGNLYELDIQKREWAEIALPAVIDKGMNRVYYDKSGGIWLYSTRNDTIYHQEEGTKDWHFISLQSSEKVQSNFTRSIQDAGNGNVWIATDHKGLFIYNKNNRSQTNILHCPLQPSSIAENSIGCIYLDNEDVLWVGYVKKGLSYHHHSFQKFVNYFNPQIKNISAVLQDRNGLLWMGTDGYGLICKEIDAEDIIKRINIPGNIIVSLLEDDKGRIWIGTYLHGLLCYTDGALKQYTSENSDLSDNSIYSLKQDRLGNIWIGTLWGHLQCLNPQDGTFQDFVSQSKDQSIANSMYYDGSDTLYAGMLSGLCVMDVQSRERKMLFGNCKGSMKFQKPVIQSVHKDKEGNLWLGHNYGLTVWDTQNDTLYYLDRQNGLCDNVVRGMAEDEAGRIWIATSNGLSVVEVHREKESELTFRINNYSDKDGLLNNNLSRHSICRLRDGRILIAGVDGYSLANLSIFGESSTSASSVVFTGLKIAEKEIVHGKPYLGRIILNVPMELEESLRLKYSDRLITFEFTSLNLTEPTKVRYAYKLKGLDDEWFYTNEPSVTFNSLPSGQYDLLLKVENGNGHWSDETSLHIEVVPPFWMSSYAYVLYAVLTMLLVWAWWKHLQQRHHLHLEQERVRIEQEQSIQLNEMKLRFFTNVSHDFRTPLTLIITPLQLILQEMQESTLQKRLVSVYRNAEQLLTLVNQLLDFRKLDAGGETLHSVLGDFVALVKDTAQGFHGYAAERGMKFRIVDEVGMLSMSFDPDKMRKVVTNLLSNAFKYTSNGGCVTLSVFREGEQIGFSVADTGIGIKDKDKKRIFDRFFQIGQDVGHTGSGIGLHIVNEYVHMHQGTVTVEDNHPQGSVFIVTLPVCLIQVEEDGAEKVPDSNTSESYVESIPSLQHPTLLLVEDNCEFCDFMAESLSTEFQVLTAMNGQEALELLNDENVNIVVTDVMMPIMDGMELCRRIKTDIRTSHIPVILLTARTAEEYRLQGFELGADDYITKPFNFNILLLRIRKLMEWTEKSHQVFSRKIDVSPSEITITPLDEQLIAKAIKIVEEHIDNSEFSVEDFSVAVGLTRGHLYKKLMSITGKSPSDFIRTIRLKRARQLLAESGMQVSEVAYSVGFGSPKLFSRSFKAEFGITPTEYIKGQKAD